MGLRSALMALFLLVVVSIVVVLTFTTWAPIHTPRFYVMVGVLVALGFLLRRYENGRSSDSGKRRRE